MNRKIAVVTGGANGIGQATAELLRDRGCTVVVVDREQPSSEQARSFHYQCDLSHPDAIASVIAEIAAAFGGCDYLVNSAGSFVAQGEAATSGDWDTILGVNVRANALLTAGVAPLMRARGGGAVVNIGSVSGHVAQPNRWTYNATKGALQTLTKCQAMDLAGDGIRVNIVSPGWIWTREVERAARGDIAGAEAAWGDYALLGRLGQPGEVAKAVAFLLSEEASYITGSELIVDGGYLAMGPEGLGGGSVFAGSS